MKLVIEARKAKQNWATRLSTANSVQEMAEVSILNRRYKDLQGLAKRERRVYMINWRKKFGGTSIGASKRRVKSFWRSLSSKRSDQSIKNLTTTANGKRFSDIKEIGKIMIEHYKKLFNPGGAEADKIQEKGWTDPIIEERINKAFSLENIKKCKGKLKTGSSPGPDNISYDMLKITGDSFDRHIHSLFNKMLRKKVWPKQFQVSLLKSIHKKGRKDLMANYRGITLSSTIGKWFTVVLYSSLTELSQERSWMGTWQAGFTPGCQTGDNVLILRTMLHRAKRLKKPLKAVFVDLKKAYDMVPRKRLWSKIGALGGVGTLTGILEAMYTNDTISIDVNGELGELITLTRGVKQGCILSPLLFNIFIADLGEALNKCPGIQIGANNISSLLFADDLMIVGKSVKEIREKIKLTQLWCKDNKMEVNFDKTKILDKNKDRLWPVWSLTSDDREHIESVPSFSYLGVPITFKRSVQWTNDPHSKQIIARAKKYKSAIYRISVESIDKGEAIKAAWENIAIPSILFGCETTVFTKKTLVTLEQIQCQVARLCLGVRSDTSGLGARVEAGMMRMSSRIMLNQLNYLNNVIQRSSESNVYQAWLENINGQWSSPLRKLWNDIKDRSRTRGIVSPKKVKSVVVAYENLFIHREIPKFASLKYMTSMSLKQKGLYLRRTRSQDILKAFRVGDCRLGIKELKVDDKVVMCPFNCKVKLDLPHFMFRCPKLERTRQEVGILDFLNTVGKRAELTDKDILVQFLWAMNDDPVGNKLLMIIYLKLVLAPFVFGYILW